MMISGQQQYIGGSNIKPSLVPRLGDETTYIPPLNDGETYQVSDSRPTSSLQLSLSEVEVL